MGAVALDIGCWTPVDLLTREEISSIEPYAVYAPVLDDFSRFFIPCKRHTLKEVVRSSCSLQLLLCESCGLLGDRCKYMS